MQLDQRKLEALLSEAFGVAVEIATTERLAPWFVLRCHLATLRPGPPRSVIVKSLREHPEGFRTDPQQILTELAALEFLADLWADGVAQVLASDTTADLLVLEDLAPRVSLAEKLQGEDRSQAEAGLSAFAVAMGDLHAVTIGHEENYYARRQALGPVNPQLERERFMGWGWDHTRTSAESFGVACSAEVESEMASVFSTLADPGPFLAFSNGDSGTNNFLIDGEGGRIIDFEFAGYRHAFTDVACLYVPGPMWITVTDPVAAGLEAAYRVAVARAVPQAEDDELFGFGIAASCLAMAVERLHRLPTLDARAPGDQGRLQMVATLESAAEAAASHGSLPRLSGWMQQIAEALRHRWPDADVDLSGYRRYTPRR
jgi:Phosphotransferase enzyme family